MSDFTTVKDISNSKEAVLSRGLEDLLNKELQFGMSSYVIKNGSLSDGFEFLDDPARFYQSMRMMYQIADSIEEQEIGAMEAEADLIDAKKLLSLSTCESETLRAEAKIKRARARLRNMRVQTIDLQRHLKAFCEVYEELAPIVRGKYKNIEEYEPERWEKVLRFRIDKRNTGLYQENLCHVPLDPVTKAKIGIETGSKDATLYLKYKEQDALNQLANGDLSKLIGIIDHQKELRKSIEKNR